MTNFIVDEKGEEVISERHQKNFRQDDYPSENGSVEGKGNFVDLDFDDI